MKIYHITADFVTPPENQGQIVTVSYGLAAENEIIITCTYDASDKTTIYDAYYYPDDDEGKWEPWNGVPEIGEHLGECLIDY